MKKRFYRKHFVTRRTLNRSRWRWIATMVIIIVLLCGAAFFIYQHCGSPLNSLTKSSTFSLYYSKVATWFAKRRNHLVKKTVSAKQTTAIQNESEPQIHFEFYTALPNMQVAGSESVAKKNEKATVAKELEHELSDALKEAR